MRKREENNMSEKIKLTKKVLCENIANTRNFGVFCSIDSSFFFPPRKFLNQFLESGSDSGDQDGITDWSPFTINELEYDLVKEWWFSNRFGVVDDLEQNNWNDWLDKLFNIGSSIVSDQKFQLGGKVINIMVTNELSKKETFSIVSKLLPEMWLASNDAIEESLKLVSNEIPNMWVSLDQLLDSMFIVYGISINPEKNEAGYHVGLNSLLSIENHPKILTSGKSSKAVEDITVYVTRDSEKNFTSELIDWS